MNSKLSQLLMAHSLTWNQAGNILPNLAKSLELQYALLTQREGQLWRTGAIAFWMKNQFGPTFQYDLDGAPCEVVFQGTPQCIVSGIQQLYPKDKDLSKLKIESYAGVPIRDDRNRIVGHVCVFDEKPFVNSQEILPLLEQFADSIQTNSYRK